MQVAIIAIACFAAGIVARHAWPLFVAWQDRKLFEKQVSSWSSKFKVEEQIARATLPTEGPAIKPAPIAASGLLKDARAQSLSPTSRQSTGTRLQKITFAPWRASMVLNEGEHNAA